MARCFDHNRPMSPEKFLLINGAIVLLIAVYILWLKRERARPSQLNLRRGNNAAKSESTDIGFSGEQELNVFFNHNSVMFDAYEVLGIPAGSPRDEIERAYQQSLEQVDVESEEIIRRAYMAIQERIK